MKLVSCVGVGDVVVEGDAVCGSVVRGEDT